MSVGINELKQVIKKLCDIIIENEVPFCELDSAAGDGDFGMSVAKGFKEVKAQFKEIDDTSISAFLKGCSMLIIEYCGGASGPIWGSGFRAAALCVKDKKTLELADIALMFESAVQGIQKRGGAKLGDKTLLDALIPAAEALRHGADNNVGINKGFEAAAAAAKTGAENTKNIAASKGRASYVGDRSISFPDAGAMAISIIFDTFLKKTM